MTSNPLYKTLIDGSAAGIMVINHSGVVEHINAATEHILEIDRDDALYQHYTFLADASHRSFALLQHYARSPDEIPSDKFLPLTLFLMGKTVNAELSCVRDDVGKATGLLVIFRDDSFNIMGISHELRTPLTPLKGFTDLLLMGAAGRISERQQNLLTHIRNNVRRLSYLIDDVLHVSEIDARRGPLQIKLVNFDAVKQRVMDHLEDRTQQQAQDFRVEFTIAPETPRIEADVHQVVRIITNVVENSFNYSRMGGNIVVLIGPEPTEQHVRIIIKDLSEDIPKDYHHRSWDRLTRHSVTLESDGGSINIGLGLPIARELVEKHEGQFWFEAEEGVGTTFYISLPIKQPTFRTVR